MWTEKQIEQLKKDGRIKSYETQGQGNNSKRQAVEKRSKAKDWLSWNLLYWANKNSLSLEEEYRFDESRKFRFDWAFASVKIAVEYEGIFSETSRHTTAKGYTGDTDKYNLAQKNGWRVIRLTAINYKTVLKILDDYASS